MLITIIKREHKSQFSKMSINIFKQTSNKYSIMSSRTVLFLIVLKTMR